MERKDTKTQRKKWLRIGMVKKDSAPSRLCIQNKRKS